MLGLQLAVAHASDLRNYRFDRYKRRGRLLRPAQNVHWQVGHKL